MLRLHSDILACTDLVCFSSLGASHKRFRNEIQLHTSAQCCHHAQAKLLSENWLRLRWYKSISIDTSRNPSRTSFHPFTNVVIKFWLFYVVLWFFPFSSTNPGCMAMPCRKCAKPPARNCRCPPSWHALVLDELAALR